MTFTVRVPATSANLGPGFDALGLAVSCYADARWEPAATPGQADHLAMRAFTHTCAAIGRPAPAMHVTMGDTIPVARGLGSSAACIVAGVLAAGHATATWIPPGDQLRIATELEGHPDNVAPALLGGLVVSAVDGGRVLSCPVALAHPLRLLALVPDHGLATERARAVLPATVPFADAARNVSRVALLVAALAGGRDELLATAFDDVLHQPYRATLVPAFATIRAAALESGAGGVYLSGAGPTIMVVNPAPGTAAALTGPLEEQDWAWTALPLDIDTSGARIID